MTLTVATVNLNGICAATSAAPRRLGASRLRPVLCSRPGGAPEEISAEMRGGGWRACGFTPHQKGAGR